jgi:hypothetical protein
MHKDVNCSILMSIDPWKQATCSLRKRLKEENVGNNSRE